MSPTLVTTTSNRNIVVHHRVAAAPPSAPRCSVAREWRDRGGTPAAAAAIDGMRSCSRRSAARLLLTFVFLTSIVNTRVFAAGDSRTDYQDSSGVVANPVTSSRCKYTYLVCIFRPAHPPGTNVRLSVVPMGLWPAASVVDRRGSPPHAHPDGHGRFFVEPAHRQHVIEPSDNPSLLTGFGRLPARYSVVHRFTNFSHWRAIQMGRLCTQTHSNERRRSILYS
jgi:hypothetical protein